MVVYMNASTYNVDGVLEWKGDYTLYVCLVFTLSICRLWFHSQTIWVIFFELNWRFDDEHLDCLDALLVVCKLWQNMKMELKNNEFTIWKLLWPTWSNIEIMEILICSRYIQSLLKTLHQTASNLSLENIINFLYYSRRYSSLNYK